MQACSFLAIRNAPDAAFDFQAAWISSVHSLSPTCSSVLRFDCLARVQQTRFSTPLLSNSWRCAQDVGAAWTLKSSNPVQFQLRTSQNLFVKCVLVRAHDDVDHVRCRQRYHHDWNTSPARGHPLREQGVRRDISRQTRAHTTVLVEER